ncbi:MerR family transcriptional regulator [Lichenihabitans sp. Uapishka_5]|uniref:MerR family transcriptional regulator n=1 Tax=Lichenihabitans sp. Uapishka_5 TaxID=3037302 RepID=UPI0029E802D6|nr:MerR family transcriptional regulator [Lichenihabitans sp. Uapishka_5]MDX7950741.1 MerR family transcriptional regulator [Lichenihabitans sp. Uapishka_5]
MEKDADAYRTISEVAEALDIPPHVLRFWETKFLQIKPLKRGGGRRYYRRADVDLLRAIRRLLYEDGYTIRGVQRLLKAQGAGAVAALPPGLAPPPDADPPGFEDATTDTLSTADLIAQLAADVAACRSLLAAARTTSQPLLSTQ